VREFILYTKEEKTTNFKIIIPSSLRSLCPRSLYLRRQVAGSRDPVRKNRPNPLGFTQIEKKPKVHYHKNISFLKVVKP